MVEVVSVDEMENRLSNLIPRYSCSACGEIFDAQNYEKIRWVDQNTAYCIDCVNLYINEINLRSY